MKRSLVFAALALPIAALAANQSKEISTQKKLEICEQVAVALDHDQEETQPWDKDTCLAGSFKVMADMDTDVEYEFVGQLVPGGYPVLCSLYNDKPLTKYAPYVENCDYLD